MKALQALPALLLASVVVTAGCRGCGKQPQDENSVKAREPAPVQAQAPAAQPPPPSPVIELSPWVKEPAQAAGKPAKPQVTFPLEPGKLIPMWSTQAEPTAAGKKPTRRVDRIRGSTGQLSRYQQSRPARTYQTSAPTSIPEEKGGWIKKGMPPAGAVPVGADNLP